MRRIECLARFRFILVLHIFDHRCPSWCGTGSRLEHQPTPEDPYPGYYLLPSGQWAAHDPAYYKKHYDKWKREYDAHVRALEKGKIKGFEGADGAEEVNALKEMEKAKVEIQEREERKALTAAPDAVPEAPKMNIKVRACVGVSRGEADVYTGCCSRRQGAHKASAVHAAHGGISEPRGFGGTDCNGEAQSEGGGEQIW